jgi:beta-fructofuranosidase
MLRLADAWTWDFWLADDGDHFHLFMLKASRALGDPDRRHWHPTIGHAVSEDLTHWTEVTDALVTSDAPAFDDRSTWTGSIVRGGDGIWRMYYTGTSCAERGLKQRIGLATSYNLMTWTKHAQQPLLESDQRWYESYQQTKWQDEAWRDPWVFRDPDGDGWHMLITARTTTGPHDDRGVIGHAHSPDLLQWTVLPPLSKPGSGFGHLEVPQVETVDGQGVLLFSCLSAHLAASRQAQSGGIWCLPIADLRGPYPVEHARRITDDRLYSGRLVRTRDGQWVLLAFRNIERAADGNATFVGELTDPMPVAWNADRSELIIDT